MLLEFDVNDYEQEENTKPEPPRHQKRASRNAYLFIDAEEDVNGKPSNDEEGDDKNDDLNGFIVADDVEFKLFISCLNLEYISFS